MDEIFAIGCFCDKGQVTTVDWPKQCLSLSAIQFFSLLFPFRFLEEEGFNQPRLTQSREASK
jgi:hypothetical protein